MDREGRRGAGGGGREEGWQEEGEGEAEGEGEGEARTDIHKHPERGGGGAHRDAHMDVKALEIQSTAGIARLALMRGYLSVLSAARAMNH